MSKKMLLAAVSTYEGHAPKLDAAVEELGEWQKLLQNDPYKFSLAQPPLTDASATRDAILDGFGNLLDEAKPNDQLVFIWCGHGTRKKRQQAIIAYPNGDPDLRNATVSVGDFEEKLRKHKPPSDVDIVVVLDSCFTDGVTAEDRIPLYASVKGEFGAIKDRDDVHKFIDLARLDMKGERSIASPMIVTAAKEGQAAYQAVIAGKKHMLFSYRAIDQLKSTPLVSAPDLLDSIKPLRRRFAQEPDVHGSSDRLMANIFPGEPESQAFSARTTATTALTFRMRIMGLGCFIPPREADPRFERRVVLPYDFYRQTDKHFGFVEVSEEDISSVTTSMTYDRYQRGGVYYRRWKLSRHRVSLANPDTTQPLTLSNRYERHAPALPAVCPALEDVPPRDECYVDFPNQQLFQGFIDLVSGSVDVASLDDTPTTFTLQYGDIPTWGPERTPRSVIAELPFLGPKAVLIIEDISGSQTAQLFIKPGATILAGNAREADVTGNGSGVVPREQFLIYYSVAPEVPDNPGLPGTSAVPVDACSIIKYP